MSEISLIFVRHGEAAENWGEHPDPGLSENGILQSQKLISNISLQSLEDFIFVSSPKSRARMTADPLIEKYKKSLLIDNIFSEIPSSKVVISGKKEWLKKIMTMNISDLPKEVSDWRNNIIGKSLSFSNNTIIFSHFMVINIVVSTLKEDPRIVSFYPDNCSITELESDKGKLNLISTGNELQTHVN